MKNQIIIIALFLFIFGEINSKVREIPLKYNIVSELAEDVFIVKHKNRYSYMDTIGNLLMNKSFYTASPFSDDLAIVSGKNGSCLLIDKKGNINKSLDNMFRFETSVSTDGFREGLAVMMGGNGKYGFIDTSGKWVIQPQFTLCHSFSEGMALVEDEKHKRGFINREGKLIIPCKYGRYTGDFCNGLAVFQSGKKLGYLNKQGEEVIKPYLLKARDFLSDITLMADSSHFFVADKQGNELFSLAGYSVGHNFYDNLLLIVDKKTEKYGYINTSFEKKIPCVYDEALDFNNGYAAVKQNGKWGFIDSNNKTIIPFRYEEVRLYEAGVFSVRLNGKWGIIDNIGNLTIPFKYDYIDFVGSGYFEAGAGSKKFLIVLK